MYSTDEQIGNYRVRSRLALDGTSSLYLAESAERGSVVIRLWDHVQLIDPGKRDAFLIEVQVLVELRHANIVSLLDYGIERDRPYVVFAHTDPAPETLYQRLKQGLFAPGQALLAFTQISTALIYAHTQNVVHGRLAPEYVSFNSKHEALLTFPLTTLPETIAVEYAEAYRAPEQQRQGILKSKLSDQYSLAAVGHALFTGPPPVSAQHLDSTLPIYARQPIARALAPQPLERFASVELFLQTLLTTSEEARTEARTQVFPQIPLQDKVVPFPPRASSRTSSAEARGPAVLFQRGRAAIIGSRRRQVISGLLLLLLLLGIAIPLIIRYAPASAANVTITPFSKHLKSDYTINAVAKNPDPAQHQISIRRIGFTARLTKTVHATGKGHQDAIQAKGTVILSNPSQNVSYGTDPSGTTTSLSGTLGGLTFDSDVTQYTPINVGGSGSIPVHIEQGGAIGNVPVHYFDGPYLFHILQGTPLVDTGQTFTATITNPDVFSGGQDAQDYMYLQQQDIDSVVNPLIDSLTASAKAEIQKQIKPNEKLVAAGITCAGPVIGGNKANDHVDDAPVSVEVTCQTDVYDPQQAREVAINWLNRDAAQQLGAHYQLASSVVVTTGTELSVTDAGFSIPITAEGVWVYQFSQTQQRQIAQIITGQAQDDALVTLRSQRGVAKATISTSGGFLGTALPWSADDIQITIVTVKGLQTG